MNRSNIFAITLALGLASLSFSDETGEQLEQNIAQAIADELEATEHDLELLYNELPDFLTTVETYETRLRKARESYDRTTTRIQAAQKQGDQKEVELLMIRRNDLGRKIDRLEKEMYRYIAGYTYDSKSGLTLMRIRNTIKSKIKELKHKLGALLIDAGIVVDHSKQQDNL